MNRFSCCWRSVAITVVAAAAGWWLADAWSQASRLSKAGPHTGPARPGWMPTAGKKSLLGAQMAGVAEAGDASAQMAAAVALANRIDPKEFAAFLESLRDLPAHSAQGLASRTVLRRWVAHDPVAALQWCASHDRDMVAGVLNEWTRITPPDQLVHLLELVPAPHRAAAIPSVFNALAPHDPEAALELLNKPGAFEAGHRISRALEELAQHDPAWLIDRAENVPNQIRRHLRSAALAAMAESDAANAMDWAMDQPDRNSLLTSLSQKPKHLPWALAAAAALPHPEQMHLHFQSIAYNASRDETAAIVEAVAAHREDLSDRLLQRFLSSASYSLARADDPGALAHRLLESGVGTFFNLRAFVSEWAQRSPDEARAWAGSLADETGRTKALSGIESIAKTTPEAPKPSLPEALATQAREGRLWEPHRLVALNVDERRHVLQAALEQADNAAAPPSSHMDRHQAFTALSTHYPAEAADLLAKSLTPANTPDMLRPLATTAAHWAKQNPQAAATWATALPPGDARAWAAANIVEQWRHYDAPAAHAWIESLPATERAIAAKSLGQSSNGQ